MESVNLSFWQTKNRDEVYNPLYEIPDEPNHVVEKYGPPDRLFSSFGAGDSFIVLCGYLQGTGVSALSFARADVCSTTKILLVDVPSGRGGECNTIYSEILASLLPRCVEEILSAVRKVIY